MSVVRAKKLKLDLLLLSKPFLLPVINLLSLSFIFIFNFYSTVKCFYHIIIITYYLYIYFCITRPAASNKRQSYDAFQLRVSSERNTIKTLRTYARHGVPYVRIHICSHHVHSHSPGIRHCSLATSTLCAPRTPSNVTWNRFPFSTTL